MLSGPLASESRFHHYNASNICILAEAFVTVNRNCSPVLGSDADETPIDLPILDPAFKAQSPRACRALAGADRPIVRVRLPSGVHGWMAVDYEVARLLLRDPRLVKEAVLAEGEPAAQAMHPLFRHMLTLDPPEHTRLRAVLSAALTAQRLRKLRPAIETIADELVTTLGAHGEAAFDLVAEFAQPLPVRVIARLLGIPAQDETLIQTWSLALLRADMESPEHANVIADEIDRYLRALADHKRAVPDNSLMRALVESQERGLLTIAEVAAMAFLVLMAGHETSVNLISNGVLNLLRTPAMWRRLSADPSLVAPAIDEILRAESPLEFATPRHVAADLTIGGRHLKRGDLVFVALGAANRDPSLFDDADVFDIERKGSTRHIAFGQGVHACPGAALARLEGELALTVLARRLPGLIMDTAPEHIAWTPGLVMRGLTTLPVRVDTTTR